MGTVTVVVAFDGFAVADCGVAVAVCDVSLDDNGAGAATGVEGCTVAAGLGREDSGWETAGGPA